MKNLQNIIEENIKWFWNNDSIVEHETDVKKLWEAFRVWCIQNCKEVFENLEEFIIERNVDKNYLNWENGGF